MSRLSSNVRVQSVGYDSSEAGEGLAIFFSQNGNDVGRWRFLVKARLDEGLIQVGEFYSSPPNSASPSTNLSRMIGGAICPGARSWTVDVSCISGADENLPPTEETPEIILASSKCCSAPIGVSRVNERYAYAAGSGAISTFSVRAGMKITGIAAIGTGGGGAIQIGSGASVIVPANISANLSPESVIAPNTNIILSNVDWVIEYLESA